MAILLMKNIIKMAFFIENMDQQQLYIFKILYQYNGDIRDEEYYKDGVLISVGIVRNQGCV